MSNLRNLRRALHIGGGTLVGALACAMIAAGALDASALETPRIASMLLLACVAVLTVTAISRRMQFTPPSARSQRASFWLGAAPILADVEIAFALVSACYAIIAVTGSMDSPMYPLLYGVVAFAVSFLSRPGAWATVGAAVILELAFFLRMPFGMDAVAPLLLHGFFLAGASAAHALFWRGLIAAHQRRRARRLERELQAQRDSARDYRLIAAALGAESRAPRNRLQEEHMLALGGVQTISDSVFHTMRLMKWALGAQTCALLWLTERGDAFKVKELASDSDDVTESSRVAAAGPLGAILRDRAPLILARTKPRQIPYYDRGDFTGAFVGVPVMEGAHLRGILCADRDQPFDDDELTILAGATEQILRYVQSEQVFRAVERAKYEHERFYHASAMLCRALTLEEVMETAFDAASQIVGFDLAAITIYEPERKRHRVYSVRVSDEDAPLIDPESLADLEFRDNTGLAAMVVKNKHYLPAGGELRDLTAPVYTKQVRLKEAESLLVLPLLSGDEAIGTFMLASRERQQFGKDVREMLGIIANQVAVSLQNGMMYKTMETMATTDGLTGLTNHRTFQDRLVQLLDRAERTRQPAAILLCDVDHFKNVNDTYGHPIGDEVLRQVAGVLLRSVRKIDIPARYGGEEFAVVLEATDLEGAMNLAERIRKDVAALVVDSDKGPFQVTMSIGIASFPDDATDRAVLIERADSALYLAKESGRNRCMSYQTLAASRRLRKAS
ncbi:sensor domain-containing diguanylate cyclase [Haliangium ochraceum]|uniref:diguanylate cyclase n=1 Tax=Haliangium ochraceum (strain DSM 14365 / JCM 11303 / SMP-2) TaxID=502025 RepID=D0LIT1_HALO1|nr:sensor domain-containing diguanylate cyclase [Haliangium ochraceum]ACY12960.1 diguanylate cyclase [Haliangium ochraceum DSM 14365]